MLCREERVETISRAGDRVTTVAVHVPGLNVFLADGVWVVEGANDDFSVAAEEVTRLDFAIGAEDKRMLELVPGVLPLDQTTLVNVQSDRCSVEWRRQLSEYLRD